MKPTVTAIVPADESTMAAASATVDAIVNEVDEVIIIWHGAARPVTTPDTDKVRVIRVPLANAHDTGLHVREGARNANGEWVLVLFPGEWLAPAGHIAIEASARFLKDPTPPPSSPWTLRELLESLPKDIISCVQVTMWCDDAAGLQCRAFTNDCRLLRHGGGIPWGWSARGFASPHPQQTTDFGFGISPVAMFGRAPILKQTNAAFLFEQKNFVAAMQESSKTATAMDKRFYVKARAELDKQAALAAFRTLFEHMSIHEELWRLEQMFQFLPYTIENEPEVLAMRQHLTQVQVGHLKTDGGEEAWYRDGSPGDVITPDFIAHAEKMPSVRCQWMIEEAKARGFRRVVEFGSVDGPNIFTWTKLAPEVEWHGVEVNPAAVAHSRKLMAETGINIKMHNATFLDFALEHPDQFDAACVFEVLEHNNPQGGTRIIEAAIKAVKDGGRVYITTPLGAWSLHDESTRKLDLKKDHILAWTGARMEAFLKACPFAKDVQVQEVENPSYFEANGWVQASFEVQHYDRTPFAASLVKHAQASAAEARR